MSYRTTTLALVCGFFLAHSAFAAEIDYDEGFPKNGGGKIHVKGTFKLAKTDSDPSIEVVIEDPTGKKTPYPVTKIDKKKETFEFDLAVPPGTYGVRVELVWKNKDNKINHKFNPEKGADPPTKTVEIKK